MVKEYVYRPYGAVHDLIWGCRDAEVLLEGPAGSGKTRGLLEFCYMVATHYPGVRILFLRNVKATLAESVLPCWENEVLWPGHPVLADSQQLMENRRSYTFPYSKVVGSGALHPEDEGQVYEGESHIVLGGLDKNQVDKTYSAQYDLICVFEAFEITEDAWQKLFRANRNWKMPWQQMIADTNPNRARHWLNLRADKPYEVPKGLEAHIKPRPGQTMMTRLCARIQDNPKFFDHKKKDWSREGADFVGKLNRLSGARKANLLEGRWVSSEGLVFEDWHRGTHVLHAELERLHDGRFKLLVDGWDESPTLNWFVGGMDWGYHPNPGTFQVWGVDDQDRRFLVAEIYRTKEQLDWWAERIAELHEEFEFQAILCDASEPEHIDMLNKRMGVFKGRDVPSLARKPSKKTSSRRSYWQTGCDHIRFGLKDPEDEFVRLYVLAGSLRHGMDENLKEQGRPVCFAQEMDEYLFLKLEDGDVRKEEEDPHCDAHGIDAARYVWSYAWGRDLTPRSRTPKYEPGSLGDVLGHSKIRRKRR